MADETKLFPAGIVAAITDYFGDGGKTFKAALMGTGYTWDAAHEDMADVSDNELNESGAVAATYEAGFAGTGRQSLSNIQISALTAGAKLDANDLLFPTLLDELPNVKGIIIYEHRTSDADSPILFYLQFDSPHVPDDGSLVYAFHPTAGIASFETSI